MSAISSIYHLIKPFAPGIPEGAIDAEVVLAAKEMARKTNALRDRAWLDAQMNWGQYPLEISTDRHLESVTQVSVGGICLSPLGSKPCNGCVDRGYWVDKNKTLYIYPSPMFDMVDGIEFEYAYSPLLASCDVDPEFLERYASDISYGVLSRVLLMKGQPWFDFRLATVYAEMWTKAKASALVDGSSLYTRGFIDIQSSPNNYLDT